MDRKEVIDFYLESDNVKKNGTIPADYSTLDWNDPNALDCWLRKHGYKFGIMPGYKEWAYVQLSKDDLMDTVIVSSIFPGSARRLGDLIDTQALKEWVPDRDSSKAWYEPLSKGDVPKGCDIILRHSTKGEGGKYYVEDGSGRSICYLRAIHNLHRDSEICGYIGTKPDPSSNFMREKFSKLALITSEKIFPD